MTQSYSSLCFRKLDLEEEEEEEYDEGTSLQAVTAYRTGPKRQGHGCLDYQLNWSEEDEAAADMLFVVEGHRLPVHSAVLPDSDLVQYYLTYGALKGPIVVKDIFWDVELENVVGFLCLVYPDAEIGQLQKGDPGVRKVAERLGCQNVLESMEALKHRKELKSDTEMRLCEVAKSVCSNPIVKAIAVGAAVKCGSEFVRWMSKKKQEKKTEPSKEKEVEEDHKSDKDGEDISFMDHEFAKLAARALVDYGPDLLNWLTKREYPE